MLSEVECDEIDNGEGSEASMKDFAIKASISEIVSLGKGGEKKVGTKDFLAGGRSYEWRKTQT